MTTEEMLRVEYRMATRKKQAKLLASGISFIDPLGSDSTVQWKVVDGARYKHANVQLADCNRKIDWYIPVDARGLAKLDKAIETMQEFRTAVVAATKFRNSLARRKA